MSKSSTITVNVRGYQMEVSIYHWKGFKGSMEEPPDPSGFEVTAIKLCDGADIFEMITEESLPTIEDVNEAVEAYKGDEDDHGY